MKRICLFVLLVCLAASLRGSAREHAAVQETACGWKKSSVETLRIPPDITTEDQQGRYLQGRRWDWLR